MTTKVKDFEKAYIKLVDQIETENTWAQEETRLCSEDFLRGMRFAYKSIMSTVEGIERGAIIVDERDLSEKEEETLV